MKSLFLGPFSLLTQYCHPPPFPPLLWLYLHVLLKTLKSLPRALVFSLPPSCISNCGLEFTPPCSLGPHQIPNSVLSLPPLPSSLIHPPAEFFQCLLLAAPVCCSSASSSLSCSSPSLSLSLPRFRLSLTHSAGLGTPLMRSRGTSDLPGW